MNETKQIMHNVARMLNESLPGLGFVLLIFQFNKIGYSNYISNTNREDIIRSLREAADRLEQKDDDNDIKRLKNDIDN